MGGEADSGLGVEIDSEQISTALSDPLDQYKQYGFHEYSGR